MKEIILAVGVTVILGFAGFVYVDVKHRPKNEESVPFGTQAILSDPVEIVNKLGTRMLLEDGHDYLVIRHGDSEQVEAFTHAGGCRKCEKRWERLLKAVGAVEE